MPKPIYGKSYIKGKSVSFFYIVSPLFNALVPPFNQICDAAGKKNVLGCVRNHDCTEFFASSSFEK
jgi:hypothetical protein